MEKCIKRSGRSESEMYRIGQIVENPLWYKHSKTREGKKEMGKNVSRRLKGEREKER